KFPDRLRPQAAPFSNADFPCQSAGAIPRRTNTRVASDARLSRILFFIARFGICVGGWRRAAGTPRKGPRDTLRALVLRRSLKHSASRAWADAPSSDVVAYHPTTRCLGTRAGQNLRVEHGEEWR